MKKYLFLLLTMFLTSFAFVSCSSDDKDEIDDAIVGTWKLTEVKMSETGSCMSRRGKRTYSSFKAGGADDGSGYLGRGEGTW